MLSTEITEGDADLRIDRFLAGLSEIGSRSYAQKAIRAGLVRVNGELCSKSYVLAAGDRITVGPGLAVVESVDVTVDVAISYEDSYLLVVDKPAGLVVHRAPSYTGPTLVDQLGSKLGGGEPDRVGVVHRLDKNTSGLLVVAKNAATLRELQKMIRRREIKREYRALVAGRVSSMSGTIEAPIGRDQKNRKQMAVTARSARAARTHFEVIELCRDASYLRVKLDTGRTHQIRVHFQAIGHPVLGDPTYGRPAFGLDRQFLHSAALEFLHPATGEDIRVSSPLPADLERALVTARG